VVVETVLHLEPVLPEQLTQAVAVGPERLLLMAAQAAPVS
jgi:hypothetical protein